MARSKRKKRKKPYFSSEVEEAIIEYNKPETTYERKCIIYKKYIYPALDKLVENIIHTNKYYNFEVCYEDTKHEVVAKLTEKIPKFSPGRGKAFSFFDRSCRNYLISYNQRVYKKSIKGEDLSYVDAERDLDQEHNRNEYIEKLSDFMDLWIDFVEENLFDMFDESVYASIADSIITLFKERGNLDFFNKKALYILIKERSRVSDTSLITHVVNILKEDFYKNYYEFINSNAYG